MLSENIYTLMREPNENKIDTIRGIDTASRVKNYQMNTDCRAEKLPNEHNSFSHCVNLLVAYTHPTRGQRNTQDFNLKN